MNFEQILAESTSSLYERTTMTPPQRKKVSDLGKIGWSIKDKTDSGILMHKDSHESLVKDDGKVEIIKEGKRYDVTEIIAVLDIEDF